MRPQSAPQRAPDYALYRLVTANDGAGALLNKSNGINFGGYAKAIFQVIPINTPNPGEDFAGVALGTSTPVVTLYAWNQVLGRFLPVLGSTIPAAPGAGLGYEFEFAANGRILMLNVTGVVTGEAVAVFASAFENTELM